MIDSLSLKMKIEKSRPAEFGSVGRLLIELQELTYTSSKYTAPQVIGLEQLLAMPGYKSKECVLDSGRA